MSASGYLVRALITYSIMKKDASLRLSGHLDLNEGLTRRCMLPGLHHHPYAAGRIWIEPNGCQPLRPALVTIIAREKQPVKESDVSFHGRIDQETTKGGRDGRLWLPMILRRRSPALSRLHAVGTADRPFYRVSGRNRRDASA